jgi:signal transduction histidine kinase
MTEPTDEPTDVPTDDAAGFDEVRRLGLFQGLADEQLRELVAEGTPVRFRPGEELFCEGRPADSWWVLLEGRIDLVRHVGRQESLLGRMDVPGRWAGGFRAWDDNGVYLATGRAATDGRLLRVPAQALRSWSNRWFAFGDHILEGLFRTARHFESLTRQKEALVSLGTLAAGLAHEINNPASAATRAAGALQQACDDLLESLRRLAARAITADQYTALDELRRSLRPIEKAPDPIEAAEREEALADWMGSRGTARRWTLAPVLAGAGADPAWCAAVAAEVGDAALEPALEWVSSTVTATRLIEEVTASTRRVSGLVAAVNHYSQLDRAPIQDTDVAEGVESTLVVLRHRMPAGVAIVRDYATGLPRIEAAPAELNQLWTHLVTNALDAMGDRGTLRVTTRPDADGGIAVEVGDSGTGMSPEVREHAFDPFFTTKGVGQGTGLGLDIARRIVDRHGGDIAIDSRPGETVLRVRLPATGVRVPAGDQPLLAPPAPRS